MGVFARLLRRSKATEEASTAEAQADIPTTEPAAEEAAEAKGSTDAEAGAGAEAKAGTRTETEGETRVEPQVEVGQTAAAKDPDGSTATEAVEDAGAESVEIPKQQSADDAADHEAGEGART
ncbi:hypothetical protein [Streptomyces sp. NPDC058307]|uniref:hypothetical protein n=1 Tax=Streptomyces sp. NPDC058307 TaxID=3346439 RepID=UPI0036EE7053